MRPHILNLKVMQWSCCKKTIAVKLRGLAADGALPIESQLERSALLIFLQVKTPKIVGWISLKTFLQNKYWSVWPQIGPGVLGRASHEGTNPLTFRTQTADTIRELGGQA